MLDNTINTKTMALILKGGRHSLFWSSFWNTGLGYPKFHALIWKQFHEIFIEQRKPPIKVSLTYIGGNIREAGRAQHGRFPMA